MSPPAPRPRSPWTARSTKAPPATRTSDWSSEAANLQTQQGRMCRSTRALVSVRSAGDLAGLEAAGAHVDALRRTVDGRPYALDVGVETALGDLARPRPVVTEAGLLRADVADGSHRALLGC